MKALTRPLWRPVRYLLLLASAGAVLAADNCWFSELRFDFTDPAAWISRFYSTEAPSPDTAVALEEAKTSGADLSTSQYWNDLLLFKPASGWTFSAPGKISTPVTMFERISQPATNSLFQPAQLPTASLSSGFVSNSVSSFGPVPSAPTGTNGVWVSNASGNWSNASNWQGGVIADGSGALADFSMRDLTTNVTVTLDTSRTVAFLEIGDTNGTNTYDITPSGGSALTFDTGAMTHADLSQTATSAGDTISAPILLISELNINNFSTTNTFNIVGNIASTATNAFQTVFFNPSPSSAGQIRVSGNISNGTTGAIVSTDVVSGTVVFTGTNTYTGSTEIEGGTLLVNGNNSGANGGVFVDNTGTLGGHGTIGGSVFTFGGTITGDTVTTVGTLTLTGNVILGTGEGPGGTYLANLTGSLSDLLAISGNLTLGGTTALNIVGGADNVTTYILATFAARTGTFDTVTGIPGGYSLVYNPTDLELVPIPEPATWICGALTLGVVGFISRRRSRAAIRTLL